MKLDWLEPDIRPYLEAMSEPQRVSLVVAGEARSEPIEGIVAVACAIRNRVKADLHHDGKPDWWGEGYSDVVSRAWQFSCLHPKGGRSNYKRVLQLAQQFAEKQPVTEPLIKQVCGVVHLVMNDWLIDNTRGSTHYFVGSMTNPPVWAKGRTPVKKIGAHWFYNDVP